MAAVWPRAIGVDASQTSGLPEAAVIQQLWLRAASFARGKQSDINIQTLNMLLTRCAQASRGPQMNSEVKLTIVWSSEKRGLAEMQLVYVMK